MNVRRLLLSIAAASAIAACAAPQDRAMRPVSAADSVVAVASPASGAGFEHPLNDARLAAADLGRQIAAVIDDTWTIVLYRTRAEACTPGGETTSLPTPDDAVDQKYLDKAAAAMALQNRAKALKHPLRIAYLDDPRCR